MPEAPAREHGRRLLAPAKDLLAEAAADVSHRHSDPVIAEAEHASEILAIHVWVLGRDVDRQLFLPTLPVGDDPARFHRDVEVAMLMDRVGYDVGAAGEGLLELRVNRRGFRPGKIRFEAAVRAKLGAQRELAPDNRRQLFVLDVDQLDRVLGQVATLGHDDRHRIADEAHVALREGGDGREREILGRPVPEPPDRIAVQLGSGPNRDDARQRSGRFSIDRGDPRVGERAACERGVQHSRQTNVVDVNAVPGQQARVLTSLHPSADVAAGDRQADGAQSPCPSSSGSACSSFMISTARRTARMIP